MTISTCPAWRHWLAALRVGAVLLVLCACGADGRYVVLGSALAPSASGVVEVDELDGGSTQVSLHLEALHPPSRLKEGLTTYVVWFEPTVGTPVRAGVLKHDPETRTGDLSQTSPFRQFSVKITAEREPEPSSPSDFVVATQVISLH